MGILHEVEGAYILICCGYPLCFFDICKGQPCFRFLDCCYILIIKSTISAITDLLFGLTKLLTGGRTSRVLTHSSSLLLSSGLLFPWETVHIKIRPMTDFQWPLSIQVKRRVTHLSHYIQRDIIQLKEEGIFKKKTRYDECQASGFKPLSMFLSKKWTLKRKGSRIITDRERASHTNIDSRQYLIKSKLNPE